MYRKQIIDILRSVGILAVLSIHFKFAGLLNPSLDSRWVCILFTLFSKNGICGVYLFFVISGYLITGLIAEGPGGLTRPDLRFFYGRRAGRIFPLLTLVCLIGAVLMHFGPSGKEPFALFVHNYPAVYSPGFWLSIATFSYNWFMIWTQR